MLASLPVCDEMTPESEKKMAERLVEAPGVDLVKHLRAALSAHRQKWPTLVSEIWRLTRGPGKLTVHEYFYYRLYDELLSFSEKRRFVGKTAQHRMHAICNDFNWFAVFHDKLLFHVTMAGLALPVPRLLAIHHPFRHTKGVPTLRSGAEFAKFLRDGMTFPCFAKPIDGMFSLGARCVESLDRAADQLVLSDGERVSVDRFVQYVECRGSSGYIFQERLQPDAELVAVFGDRVSTVRLIVLIKDDGPELFGALCKIPTGQNVADNFWRSGNMLGALNLDDGVITRVVAGIGEDQVLVDRHPNTDRPIVGTAMPHWQEMKELCLVAASALSGARTQAWDIALCPSGPVLVEANFGGDFNLPQLAFGAGVLDDRFRQHLASCGYRLD
jgi:hypothetical protein